MSQDTVSRTEQLGKAFESARKNSKRAARKLSEGQLLSLAMLDQGRPSQPAIDRAFVQHGVCL